MARERVYDEIRRAAQDFVVEEFLLPDLRAIVDDLRRVAETIDRAGRAASVDELRAGVLSVLRRLEARTDSIDRELRSAIDVRARLAALEARRAP